METELRASIYRRRRVTLLRVNIGLFEFSGLAPEAAFVLLAIGRQRKRRDRSIADRQRALFPASRFFRHGTTRIRRRSSATPA